ncbi:GntR family transcriptional regulator [Kitasatospora purpeofusca]|uniref:GntR family transcriptional regulator n=1 Tax=Kitasatospora purpeofusca TaxID=67352 RepID=UPI002E14E23C|nr:GntR family transcriptional regulator [Kitasatospora purpeofusca]
MAKYEKIADDLRARIRAGEWAPGAKLPSETPELTAHYKTSLPTIRQALAVLSAEGVVDKVHGRGNFVRKPRTVVVRTNERHQWEKDRARQPEETRQQTGATEHDTGLSVSDLVFHAEFRETEAGEGLASIFGVPVDTVLLERTYRTRYRAEDEPFNVARSYLVYDMVKANPDLLDVSLEPWPGGTQNQLFTIGIELDRIVERITARPPTAEETEDLGLKVGVSVFVLQKVSYDTDGRVVEVSNVTMPGDRTEMVFTTPLNRW